MAKQFLLHLDICAVLVEQTRIGVPAGSTSFGLDGVVAQDSLQR